MHYSSTSSNLKTAFLRKTKCTTMTATKRASVGYIQYINTVYGSKNVVDRGAETIEVPSSFANMNVLSKSGEGKEKRHCQW